MPAGFASYLTGASRGQTPAHPLTHHEILALMAPFTRRGRQADLDASNRIERRLLFKPIEHDIGYDIRHDDVTDSQVAVRDVLTLDNPQPDHFTLTRTLTLPSGLEAQLQTQGSDPGELLDRIESVSPKRQFREVSGVAVALSYQLIPLKAGASASPPLQLELTRGEAIIAGLDVVLNADGVKGYPAQIDLKPTNGATTDLPDDLLAVIGWGWSPLRKTPAGWAGKLKARSKEPQRSRDFEAKFDKAVAHLVSTLTQPPSFFYDRLRGARWAVTLRRGIPLFIFIGMMGLAFSLTMIQIPPGSIFNLLMMGAPPLLLFAAFGMRDAPPLEIPPLPSRAKASSWPFAPAEPAAIPVLAAVATSTPSPPTSPAAERDQQCPAIQ